jgi:hypothetical protein
VALRRSIEVAAEEHTRSKHRAECDDQHRGDQCDTALAAALHRRHPAISTRRRISPSLQVDDYFDRSWPAALVASADLLSGPAVDPLAVGREKTEGDAAHAIQHPDLDGLDDQRAVKSRPVVTPQLLVLDAVTHSLQRRTR